MNASPRRDERPEPADVEAENAEWKVFCVPYPEGGRLYPAYLRVGSDTTEWVRPEGMTVEYAERKYNEALAQWFLDHPEESDDTTAPDPSRNFDYGRPS